MHKISAKGRKTGLTAAEDEVVQKSWARDLLADYIGGMLQGSLV